MNYSDGLIIKARLEATSLAANSITKDIVLENVIYHFSEKVFSPYFSMIVPENFEYLSKEFSKRKYPYEDRPEIIISSPDTKINFAYSVGENHANDPLERLSQYRGTVKHLHPSNVFYRKKIYLIHDDTKIACYDYRSTALDGDVYNLSFFTDLPSGELFGWFSCPAELQDKWEPLVRQMIQTIKPLPQEND